jgi:putative addiction module killer protein
LYPSRYKRTMNTIVRTAAFDSWLSQLGDAVAKARIIKRIRSAERGNFGDHKIVGGGVWEMRVHHGPGYRVYFARQGEVVYVLLCGGTKSRQQPDILRAQTMARQLKLDTKHG